MEHMGKINLIIEVSKSLPVDEIPDSPSWQERAARQRAKSNALRRKVGMAAKMRGR